MAEGARPQSKRCHRFQNAAQFHESRRFPFRRLFRDAGKGLNLSFTEVNGPWVLTDTCNTGKGSRLCANTHRDQTQTTK
jgi:hypothetical protein